jgi:hypothetical protein
MRRMPVDERRARLAARHRLAGSYKAGDAFEVARDLVALHSTDAATVYLAALARMSSGGLEAVDQALYEERTVVRVMGMRRTVFVVPAGLVPVVIAASGVAIAERGRKMLLGMLTAAGVAGDVEQWLREAESAALDAVEAAGQARASEVAEADPRLNLSVVLARGKAYEGRQKVASRVLAILAAEGRIVRARPVGSWRSSQYRWSSMDRWMGGLMPSLTTQEAVVQLARCWLRSYGPGTVEDFRWWSGIPAAQVKAAWSDLPLAEVELDGAPGAVLDDDLDSTPQPPPWVAVLPALDSTPMGWKHRAWYVGDHARALFDGTGNIGPTVWADGRIVGGWAQRPGGEIAVKLLEDIGTEAAGAVAVAAAELENLIGPVKLAPRARVLSPVEQELSR